MTWSTEEIQRLRVVEESRPGAVWCNGHSRPGLGDILLKPDTELLCREVGVPGVRIGHLMIRFYPPIRVGEEKWSMSQFSMGS
jgi:hypothetical protein